MNAMLCLRTSLILGVIFLVHGHESSAAEPREIYRHTVRATALVRARSGGRECRGTAWVVDRQRRWLITSQHVLEDAPDVQVMFPIIRGGRVLADRDYYKNEPWLKGRVLAANPRCDLALIELARLPDEAAELMLASDSAEPGERVHSVSNPGQSEAYWAYSQGIIRQVAFRRITLPHQVIDTLLVEIQSPVNPGDSGSPLVNDQGEVVAVVAASHERAHQFGLAIDVTRVRQFVDSIRGGRSKIN